MLGRAHANVHAHFLLRIHGRACVLLISRERVSFIVRAVRASGAHWTSGEKIFPALRLLPLPANRVRTVRVTFKLRPCTSNWRVS